LHDFPDSDCQIQFLEDYDACPTRTLYFPFSILFEKGVGLLEEIKNAGGVVPDSVEGHIVEALQQLNNFFKHKGRNIMDFTCLLKICLIRVSSVCFF
jgi:hypothetical protein